MSKLTIMNFRIWIVVTYIFQLLTGVIHSLSFFGGHQASNDAEKPLIDAITTIHLEMGAGFHPTFSDLFYSVSAALTLLCLFSGIMNWYLLKLKLSNAAYKSIMAINMVTFGIYTVVNYFFAFLPPLICIGLIFFSSLMAYIANRDY